ncbi:hypothetical protein ACH5RR_005354 [Cinchona calisaya]|uniref:Cation/H+ exchanger domain-containing protein n=1 Tax=Cinchona calisaya TaxID=153742 RepID=A0ABD3AKZ8_9GENT
MGVNITSIKTSSNGIWEGDNPLNFAFSLLIVQTILILVVSRFFTFLLKPLRQPKVVAEILGGIILGPSAFGRNQDYMHRIFPKWSTPILESVASIGLLFYLFLVGLELDISSIRRSGRSTFSIAAAGVSLPFILGIGIAFLFRKVVDGADKVGYAQYLVFMGVALSITAFPVLARILAELKLLTTRVGETAMAVAAFNDIAAWMLLAVAIALAGDAAENHNGPHKSPLISLWVLLTGASFVVFMMVFIRPVMEFVGRKCSPEHDTIDEVYICSTLAGVMVAGFVTDFIGIHAIFGAFVFGLTIPKGGYFAERLMERIEDFVSGLLLPLYFASSGLKTDVAKIHGANAWGLLVLVISTACVGKILGTFSAAMLCKIPARESLTLGVLMNTKGLVELIVLNIGKEKKVLNDEAFAILVLMALFTTFITTPTVMAIYKPARGSFFPHPSLKLPVSQNNHNEDDQQLRILACLHGPANVPSIINLVESIRPTNAKSRLKLYIMHLVELTERSSSIVKLQRLQKNGLPFINRLCRSRQLNDGVAMAFRAYGQMGRVSVRPATAVSALPTMHQDICHVAENKRVALIILPFHKHWRKTNGDGENENGFEYNVGQGWRGVHQRVLKEAGCAVAVLVNREPLKTPPPTPEAAQRVCVMFIGGPDDREALELGGRMAEHPAVKVTVIRFVPKDKGMETAAIIAKTMKEKELDEEALAWLKKQWKNVEYKEKATSNIVEGVLGIGRSGDFELIIVGKGKGRCPSSTLVAELADRQPEHAELGPLGDLLASPDQGIVSSALVIQQHDLVHLSKMSYSSEIDKTAAHMV